MKVQYFVVLVTVFFGSIFSIAMKAELTPEEIEAEFQQNLLGFNKQRLKIISESIAFTPKQAAGFWAVYEDYSREMKDVQDAGAELLNDYFTDIGFSITDKTALELNLRSFDIDEKKVNIRRKYFPQFSAATNYSIAAQFMQIDRMVDATIELLIAQSLPKFPSQLSSLIENGASDKNGRF